MNTPTRSNTAGQRPNRPSALRVVFHVATIIGGPLWMALVMVNPIDTWWKAAAWGLGGVIADAVGEWWRQL